METISTSLESKVKEVNLDLLAVKMDSCVGLYDFFAQQLGKPDLTDEMRKMLEIGLRNVSDIAAAITGVTDQVPSLARYPVMDSYTPGWYAQTDLVVTSGGLRPDQGAQVQVASGASTQELVHIENTAHVSLFEIK